jgi:hypothetical protein
MSDTPKTQCETPHYYGCACHEKGWQNKWQCAVEMAAQAESKLDALVEHHTRMIIAHAKEVDSLLQALAGSQDSPNHQCDGCQGLSQLAHWELPCPSAAVGCIGTTINPGPNAQDHESPEHGGDSK